MAWKDKQMPEQEILIQDIQGGSNYYTFGKKLQNKTDIQRDKHVRFTIRDISRNSKIFHKHIISLFHKVFIK